MVLFVAVMRIISGILIASWLGPVLAAGIAGLGVPMVSAMVIGLTVAIAATVFSVWQWRGVDWILDVMIAGPRILLFVVPAAAIATCVVNARLMVFMIDSSQVNYSYGPSDRSSL